MSEKKKMIINEKDFVACNYFEACDYYKQLKRLQDKYNTVVNKFFNSETDKTRLQKENEKLKEVTNEAKIEYENLLINRNEFAERADKYRQALEEIRSYCEEQNLKADYTACEVLAIIDEVLDEN